MRVLLVHNRYRSPGGEDAVVEREAGLLRSHGHEVLRYEVENPEGNLAASGPFVLAPWNVRAARRLRETAQVFQPDVAHVHNTWFALSPAVFATLKSLDIPTVATMHNYRMVCSNGVLFRDGRVCLDCVGSHPWHAVAHACYRDSRLASVVAAATISINRALSTWERNVDLFLALSPFARDRLIDAGLPEDRVLVRPNFVPDPGPRSSLPSASTQVVFVGRMTTEKGIGVLLEAWERAQPEGLELVAVGDGPLRAELMAQRFPNLRFAGSQSPAWVRQLMLNARALVFPSLVFETFGLTIVEAMAAGLPVVASDLGVTPAIVEGVGRLVRAGDVGAWESALRKLAESAELNAMGEAGRRSYERSFTPTRGLESLLEAYERVLRP